MRSGMSLSDETCCIQKEYAGRMEEKELRNKLAAFPTFLFKLGGGLLGDGVGGTCINHVEDVEDRGQQLEVNSLPIVGFRDLKGGCPACMHDKHFSLLSHLAGPQVLSI